MQNLEGNPGKRTPRGPPPNLGAAPAMMPPPAHLTKMAKAFWKTNYEPLRSAGILEATDLLTFELLCAAYSRWREAEAQLEADGARVRTSNGGSGASPFFRIARMCAAEVRGYCEQFGLTPPSRARLEVTPPKPPPGTDEEGEENLRGKRYDTPAHFAGLIGRHDGKGPAS